MTYAEKGASRYFGLYKGRYERDDFVSAAYTGLVVAARKFDPSRGVKFTTYSFLWIDQHLKRMTMNERRQTGWSYHPLKDESVGHKGMIRRVYFDQFPEVTDPETGHTVPYDFPDPASREIEEHIVARSERDQQRRQILGTARNSRARRVLKAHMDGHTMSEIARREGVSRQRVHQILIPALEAAIAKLSKG